MNLGNIFKTIAVMEGDYDNGKDKVAVAKEYMGEDGFQMYQRMYPEKYEKQWNTKNFLTSLRNTCIIRKDV